MSKRWWEGMGTAMRVPNAQEGGVLCGQNSGLQAPFMGTILKKHKKDTIPPAM
jgi:hypothetical protein